MIPTGILDDWVALNMFFASCHTNHAKGEHYTPWTVRIIKHMYNSCARDPSSRCLDCKKYVSSEFSVTYVCWCLYTLHVVQVCGVHRVPPVCCVCVCTTVPTCVVPCTSTIPTVFIIFINYCISHQLFNSHSQLTLTTYTHNFTNVYRTSVPVARST